MRKIQTKPCKHCNELYEKHYYMSQTNWENRSKYCSRRCLRKDTTCGEKHYNWKGGISGENRRLRHSVEYREWRTSVFERDDYTCMQCGKRGVYLEANHIKRFIDFPKLRLDIGNGITLCRPCHDATKGKEESFETLFYNKLRTHTG